jgi:hypothetical protein
MELPDTLKIIIHPGFGSIWRVPNKIWKSFAREKEAENLHPGIISKEERNGFTFQLTPGTSRKSGGRCVFKAYMNSQKKRSHFIIKLSVPITKTRLLELKRGWNGVDDLSFNDKNKFRIKIRECNQRRRRWK